MLLFVVLWGKKTDTTRPFKIAAVVVVVVLGKKTDTTRPFKIARKKESQRKNKEKARPLK
jgi:hypothetical protein